MAAWNPNLADLLGSELNQVPATEEIDLAALLQSNLNMTPFHPLLSPPSSSENVLNSLLTSNLNNCEVQPTRTSHDVMLQGLLTSELNSDSPPFSAISRKRTLDQLLESDLNLSPSRSPSPALEHVANCPRTLTPLLESREILSPEQATLDVLLDSDLNGDPQQGEDPMDGVEGEEKKEGNVGQDDMPTRDHGLSWRGILDIESRVFKVLGKFNREERPELEYKPSVEILLERKKHASQRYAELLRDKMTLWEVREQLEISERSLMRILKEH